ncbi:hypothetical protein FHS57_001202 [Runella defluvii]|uniref:Uncharacterized protein n=1 Tax=Runella defluvii TaxID=370973 RepID=A0A7W6EP84_9BACT|nr:hypothetical protein [Runella defluvii]MBB3837208.1 hypothetical protein [Runella defluvii]
MNALRQILTPSNGQLLIDIPKEYQQKRFEVIVLPIDETTEQDILKAKMTAFLNTLPTTEPTITEAEILAEIKAVRKERYER